jgi:hypothetical protein
MKGNCEGRFLKGNSGLILEAVRSDWWTDRNCRTVFRDNAKWNLGFWGQMKGWLDFWVEKEKWVLDRKDGI